MMKCNIKYITSIGKRSLSAVAMLGSLLVVPQAAESAVIARDNFSYSVGELNGQNGGTGWSGAWAGVATVTEVVDPGVPLSYSSPGLGVNGGNRALEVDANAGNNNNAASRTLASAQSADTIYVSFLVRTSGVFSGNDFGVFWFDNVATGSHTGAPNIGIKSDGSGTLDFMSRLALGQEVYSTASVAETSYLVVGRLTKSIAGPGNNYDRFSLWVNPTAGDMNTPDATAVLGASVSSFSTVGIRTANLDPGDRILFDHFMLSTTFNEAVGIPEPASFILLGGAGALLALFGRRRFVR
jgi:hypothetical protein